MEQPKKQEFGKAELRLNSDFLIAAISETCMSTVGPVHTKEARDNYHLYFIVFTVDFDFLPVRLVFCVGFHFLCHFVIHDVNLLSIVFLFRSRLSISN